MEPGTTALRWMWIWITLCALVVVVVIGFLFGITSSLNSIDDGLAEANTAVGGAGGDVKPLPTHIQTINGSLTEIDESAKPLTRQADTIIRELESIDSTPRVVNGSLTDTSGLLVDTSRSLVDTSNTLAGTSGSLVGTGGTLVTVSNTLVRVLGQANRIESVLVDIQRPELAGTNAIWRRVRFLNGGRFRGGAPRNTKGLVDAEQDAAVILRELREVNKHVTSVCQQIVTPEPC